MTDSPPFISGSDTSEAAAESMKPSVPYLRRRVLDEISWWDGGEWRPHLGATCDDVEYYTGLSHQTASARIVELRKLNLIKDSGNRRKTRSGRRAVVWQAVS